MRGRLTGAAAVAAALSLALPTAAMAAPSSPASPSPATTTITPDAHHDAGGMTDEELKRQIHRAEELRAELLAADKEMAELVLRLESASAKANKALEAYATARDEARAANEKADQQAEIAKTLQERLNNARADLRDWAVDAYTQGGSLAEELGYLDALSKEASQAADPLSDLDYLTDNKIRSVEEMREIVVREKIASMTAESERDKADAASAKAKRAKDAATDLVERQKKDVAALRKKHQERTKEATPLAGLLLGSGDGDAVDAAERLADALKNVKLELPDLSLKPCSEDTGEGYPNGQIPPSALCPMVGSGDEFLTPKAAAAFNEMSKAYAEDTGHLLCVTDGYRSYAEQVAVKAERGMWAATPGTSNHGFGLAADLCGGVNNYSDPAHLWMVQNAAIYGWFHPAWAAQGGRLPEPWHWEYAG